MGLLEQEVCYFYADFIRDWATHISPRTKGEHADTIPFTVSLVQNATCIAPSTREAWILTSHMLLLPVWGAGASLHGQSHDKDVLRLNMHLCHPLDLW